MADTHDNKDVAFPKELLNELQKGTMENLEQRMKRMTAEQRNTITAGTPGEKALIETGINGFLIRKLPDDPDCLRISIGEPNHSTPGKYVVIRGDIERAERVIQEALDALRGLPNEA